MPEGFDAPPLRITRVHLAVIVTGLLLLTVNVPYLILAVWLTWVVCAMRNAMRRDELVWELLAERQANR